MEAHPHQPPHSDMPSNANASKHPARSASKKAGGPPTDINPEEVIIAVMGSTGTGKSSFVKLITGDSSVQIGENLESETFDVKDFGFVDQTTGRRVRIVDTPGFDDSRAGVTDTDILKKIADYLLRLFDNNQKLNGLIYLHWISDPRFGGQSARNLRMFRELCGAQNYKNVVVLTTFWGRVDKIQGPKREQQLKAQFFRPLVEGGARFMRHNQTVDDAREVLSHIYALAPVNPQITEEIRIQGKTLEDTAAGAVLREEAEAFIAKHNEEMADIQAKMATIGQNNVALRRALEEERATMQQQLSQRQSEVLMLKKGLEGERGAQPVPAAVLATEADRSDGLRDTHEPGPASQVESPENSVRDSRAETHSVSREQLQQVLAEHEKQIASLRADFSMTDVTKQLARLDTEVSELRKALNDDRMSRGRGGYMGTVARRWLPDWVVERLHLG